MKVFKMTNEVHVVLVLLCIEANSSELLGFKVHLGKLLVMQWLNM